MEIIDLTHSIGNEMPVFGAKWHCKTEIEKMGKVKEVGRNTTKLTFGSHCGTHIDSPNHFIDDGKTIDKIDLKNLVGKVQILDFSYLKENEAVKKADLEKIDLEEKIIFYFDWAKNFLEGDFYHNYPYFTLDAANYLAEKGVKFIGMDTPSPDDSRIKLGSKEDSQIHKIFLKNGIILSEYLNIPKIENKEGWFMCALPLKIKDCDGSPARVVLYKE